MKRNNAAVHGALPATFWHQCDVFPIPLGLSFWEKSLLHASHGIILGDLAEFTPCNLQILFERSNAILHLADTV